MYSLPSIKQRCIYTQQSVSHHDVDDKLHSRTFQETSINQIPIHLPPCFYLPKSCPSNQIFLGLPLPLFTSPFPFTPSPSLFKGPLAAPLPTPAATVPAAPVPAAFCCTFLGRPLFLGAPAAAPAVVVAGGAAAAGAGC